MNGFSHSGAETFTVDVAPSALPVPGMTTPMDASLPALGSIDGTGMPGAIVTLSGDVSGTGTVALDGHWTVPVDGQAAFGKVTVTARLSSPGIADSPSTTQSFTVILQPRRKQRFRTGCTSTRTHFLRRSPEAASRAPR